MVPKHIHFVWLGGKKMPAIDQQNIERFALLNPSYTIDVWRDDVWLHEDYRPAWKASDCVGQRTDLLRLSVLERYGGWYFDTDTIALNPLPEQENPGRRLFTHGFFGTKGLTNACLAATPECAVWPWVHEYICLSPLPASPLRFANEMMDALRKERPQLLQIASPDRFTLQPKDSGGNVYAEVSPLLTLHGFLGRGIATPAKTIPYRLDLAGGWLDHPFVSRHGAGPVVNVSLEPTRELRAGGGLAGSTRASAIQLWGDAMPDGDLLVLARTLWKTDNPPEKEFTSGSQDALGIVLPGLHRLDYNGNEWPVHIETVTDEKTLSWLEAVLWLVPLPPRPADYSVVRSANPTREMVQTLSASAWRTWHAIADRDATHLGESITDGHEALCEIFPAMRTEAVSFAVEACRKNAIGWKTPGAGGGGYLLVVSEKPVPGAIRPIIRRGPGGIHA